MSIKGTVDQITYESIYSETFINSDYYKEECVSLLDYIKSIVNSELDNYNEYYRINISKILSKTCFHIVNKRSNNN